MNFDTLTQLFLCRLFHIPSFFLRQSQTESWKRTRGRWKSRVRLTRRALAQTWQQTINARPSGAPNLFRWCWAPSESLLSLPETLCPRKSPTTPTPPATILILILTSPHPSFSITPCASSQPVTVHPGWLFIQKCFINDRLTFTTVKLPGKDTPGLKFYYSTVAESTWGSRPKIHLRVSCTYRNLMKHWIQMPYSNVSTIPSARMTHFHWAIGVFDTSQTPNVYF